MGSVAWRQAWHDALYDDRDGFYRLPGGPAAHFTTAANGPTGAALARGLMRLWARQHHQTPQVVVDLGAGRGELTALLLAELTELTQGTELTEYADLAGLREHGGHPTFTPAPGALTTPTTRFIAVDVASRPEGLDERVEWLRSPGGTELPEQLQDLRGAFVIAHEWLDVVPCTVAQVDERGVLRTVLVDPASGEESLGEPLPDEEEAWCRAHWPAHEPGARVEVGSSRDRAWRSLVGRVTDGLVVAVDYGHTRETRPQLGTLTGYRAGGQVEPVPDGSCDITAHVAVDSLEADHVGDGETADHVGRQRDVLRGLGLRAEVPPHHLARSDPARYLQALQRCSAEAALIDAEGFGGFWWVTRQVPSRPVV